VYVHQNTWLYSTALPKIILLSVLQKCKCRVIDTLMDSLDIETPKEASGHEKEEGMIKMN
jgi:hypothetical protein